MSNQPNPKGRSALGASPAKSNSNKQTKKKRVRKSRVRVPMEQQVTVLRPCSLNYLQALTNPFDYYLQHSAAPCYPDAFDEPSLKMGYRLRGTLDINVQGWAFLQATPYNTDNTGAPSVTNCAASHSTILHNSSQFPGNSSSNISYYQITNSPFDAGAGAVRFRPVALGMRVRYIGTELNRGGRIIPVFISSSQGCAASTATELLTLDAIHAKPVDRKWHGTFWRPNSSADSAYRTSNTNLYNYGNIGIAVTGVASTAAQYEFEIVWYHEYCPTVTYALANATRSEADVPGVSYIRDFIGSVSGSEAGQQVYNAGIGYIKKVAISSLTTAMSGGLAIAM